MQLKGTSPISFSNSLRFFPDKRRHEFTIFKVAKIEEACAKLAALRHRNPVRMDITPR